MSEIRNIYDTSIRNKNCDDFNIKHWICLAMLIILPIVFNYFDVVFDLQIKNIRCSWDTKETKRYKRRLLNQYQDVKLQLKMLSKKHGDLIERVRNLQIFNKTSNALLSSCYLGPLLNGKSGQVSMETYETIRLRIKLMTKELWYYLNYRLLSAAYQTVMPGEIQNILHELAERKSWLLSWQQRLESSDGYEEWRRKEAASVSDLVQRRLSYLQNPPDCRTAKKLVCNMDINSFGRQLHHIAFCLINAYAAERTLVLNSSRWTYSDQGWESVFYPISDTCNNSIIKEIKRNYFLGISDPNVLHLGTLLHYMKISRRRRLLYLPYQLPKDIAMRVHRFNGDPASWWIGQIIKYILRPRKHIQTIINETITKLDFRSPVIGIQVQRTDEIKLEVPFHDIDEYMSHVADYYGQLQLTRDVDERRVYLATDEPRMIKKAERKYKQYTFFSSKSIAESAKIRNSRYSPASLTGLLVNLHLLALSDYVVCTFSSHMKQANLEDASNYVHSLDYVYFFATEQPYYRTAVKRNIGRYDFIDLEIGDQIEMQCWDFDCNEGSITREDQWKEEGPVPLYKTIRHITLHPYPEYPQVPIHSTTADTNLSEPL